MNLPKDFTDRMKQMLKDEYDEYVKAFNDETAYTGVRINPNKENVGKFLEENFSKEDKVLWCGDGYYTDKSKINGNHPYHIAGVLYFQEPSAMSCVEMLDIKENDFILDLCAAPGGKATQAGVKLSDEGLLVANEIIPKRASVLAENIERFGFKNAIVTNESPDKLCDKFCGFFDKIIVDAPCSGEGMFKKEPQAIDEWSVAHTKTCAVRQMHIMDCAYKMLREDGYIAYSTCTFAPCENEGVIDYMLNTYSDLELCDTGLDMLSCGVGKWADCENDMSKTRRIFPHKNKGEGHFTALLHKKGEPFPRNIKAIKEDKSVKQAVTLYKEFEKEYLNIELDGCFRLFGDNLYLVPHSLDLDKIKLVRCGLHLGVVKKNRFEPSYALSHALNFEDFKNKLSFCCDDTELLSYLKGETIASDIKGYAVIAADKNPIGWAKGSGGILKNHFPKYLRR